MTASRTLLIAASTLLTASVTEAQFTTPPGHLTKQGNRYAYNAALNLASPAYKIVRYQVTDPDMTRATALFRMDYRTQQTTRHGRYSAQGRSFTNVTLKLGNAASILNHDMNRSFAAAPTQVFSAKWSHSSFVGQKPKLVWGNAFSFPFSRAMLFQPKAGELLQEWTHAGGQLANGSSFSSPLYLDGGNKSVPLSAYSIRVAPAASSTSSSRYVPVPSGSPCGDSAFPTMGRSVAQLVIYVCSNKHPNFSVRGGMVINTATVSYTAPGKPVVAMLSLWGNDSGVKIGARCNRLHVNPRMPLSIITRTGSAYSTTSFQGRGGFPVTPAYYSDVWAGAQVYWQAAWEDSRDKAFSLSVASKLTLPKKPASRTPGIAESALEYFQGYPPKKFGPYIQHTALERPIIRWNKK